MVDEPLAQEPCHHILTALDAFVDLAMRLNTDASRCWLAQTVSIEIGGALTDNTPPEFSAVAS